MGYLFGQTWIWILISFVLGLVIGFLIAWFFGKKSVDSSAGAPDRRTGSTGRPRGKHQATDAASTWSAAGLVGAGGGAGAGAVAGSHFTQGRQESPEELAAQYPGSAAPTPDGSAPTPDYTVKGSLESMRFHTIESPDFSYTPAEIWFRTATDAESAGFTAWNKYA